MYCTCILSQLSETETACAIYSDLYIQSHKIHCACSVHGTIAQYEKAVSSCYIFLEMLAGFFPSGRVLQSFILHIMCRRSHCSKDRKACIIYDIK